jgi:hypothetical protein
MSRLEQIAAMIESTDPLKAAELRRLAQEQMSEGLKVSVGINWQLQKFDGDYSPDKMPVETLEGTDILS